MVSSTVFDTLNPLLVCCCDLEINIIFPSTSSCFSLGSPVLAAWPLTFAASVGMLYSYILIHTSYCVENLGGVRLGFFSYLKKQLVYKHIYLSTNWSVANEFCKVFLGKNSERIVTGFKAYLYDPGTQSLSIIS